MNVLVSTYPLQPVNVVEVLFCVFCVYGIILLWGKPRINALCLLLAIEALLMAFNFFEETKLLNHSMMITPVFTLCTGPAFYLFVRHLIFHNAVWAKTDLGHFVPVVIALPFTAFSQLVIAAGSISLVIYGLICYRWLLIYRDASKQMSAAALDMRLTWLQTGMVLFAVLGVTDLIRLNTQPYLPYEVMNSWYLIHQILVLILYASLVYYALAQPLLFDGLHHYQDSLDTANENSLDHAVFSQIEKKIVSLQLHRKPRLSLHDIAELTGLNIRDISSAVNRGSGLNFCEYINRLRIEEIKNHLSEHGTSKFTLLESAMNAGFNSKSSFNAAFKSEVGLTPSQYLAAKQK